MKQTKIWDFLISEFYTRLDMINTPVTCRHLDDFVHILLISFEGDDAAITHNAREGSCKELSKYSSSESVMQHTDQPMCGNTPTPSNSM